ncbi:hypothetical protein KUCAC02_027303, partial [Chaenocephalus aceratus]
MCQVCNIQLNSSAQAQIHYRGKTHQRRLRRLAKAVTTAMAPTPSGRIVSEQTQYSQWLCHAQVPSPRASSTLSWVRCTCRADPCRPTLQPRPHAQLEHFLPLRVNSSSPLSLFPNFSA